MKNSLKVLFLILGVFMMTGCFGNLTPSERVEDMLNRYVKNDKSIIDELDVYLDRQDLTKEQKSKYGNIIKNEYATIKYNIKDEKINGDEAVVEVDLEVIDLYKASKIAGDYLKEHATEFYTDGVYDKEKFTDYKLEVMEGYGETVKYDIEIDLVRKDGLWTIEQLDDETLEKIHGIYDYESDTES